MQNPKNPEDAPSQEHEEPLSFEDLIELNSSSPMCLECLLEEQDNEAETRPLPQKGNENVDVS